MVSIFCDLAIHLEVGTGRFQSCISIIVPGRQASIPLRVKMDYRLGGDEKLAVDPGFGLVVEVREECK